MQYYIAYIGIGTNIEPRRERMNEAIASLSEGWSVIAKSSIYETSPVGFIDQPDFYNAVVAISTHDSPHALHQRLKSLEQELGRQERERWHEREIDFDILLYDDRIIHESDLTIPHPELHKRLFVLVPLAELVPELKHPILGKTIRILQSGLEVNGMNIKRISDE